MDYDHKIKIIIIGDYDVGKSCILTKFIDDEFIPKYNTTVGVDYKTYRIDYLDKHFKLLIWDTGGQERFRAITKSFYRGVNAVIICFDLTNVSSYNNVDLWLKEILKEKLNNPIIFLVGTKADMVKSREITKEEAIKKANLLNFYAYYETSAKNNICINDIFYGIVKLYCSFNDIRSPNRRENIQINPDSKSSKINLSDETLRALRFLNNFNYRNIIKII